jgi:hypothetical protein
MSSSSSYYSLPSASRLQWAGKAHPANLLRCLVASGKRGGGGAVFGQAGGTTRRAARGDGSTCPSWWRVRRESRMQVRARVLSARGPGISGRWGFCYSARSLADLGTAHGCTRAWALIGLSSYIGWA